MRVCSLHIEKAIVTLKNTRDDGEYDLCPACWEMVQAAINGMYEEKEVPKQNKTKKEVTHVGKLS